MRVLILHAYSAANAGDGLLVERSVDVLEKALVDFAPLSIEVAALRPETFLPSPRYTLLWTRGSRSFTRSGVWWALVRRPRPDLVVEVGGGYLRGKSVVELMKTSLAHLPQLAAAALKRSRAVYLPQSVGPFSPTVWRLYRLLLNRVDVVYLRDDRSITEAALRNSVRTPDLAVSAAEHRRPRLAEGPLDRVVLSVRELDGDLPQDVERLAQRLTRFHGYVQSRGGGNDDQRAVEGLGPELIIDREELLKATRGRVIIAMRLHAALMCINAGHYVIHLGYERKGWGAFEDLGLSEYVHNARSFDVDTVLQQVRSLETSSEARRSYDVRLHRAWQEADGRLDELSAGVRHLVRRGVRRG